MGQTDRKRYVVPDHYVLIDPVGARIGDRVCRRDGRPFFLGDDWGQVIGTGDLDRVRTDPENFVVARPALQTHR